MPLGRVTALRRLAAQCDLPPQAARPQRSFCATTRGASALAARNDGFSTAVSDRALIGRRPIAASFAQAGISPRAQHGEAAPAVRGGHHGDVLARRRVVAGPQVERRAEEAHQLVELGPRAPVAEPPTHARHATVASGADVNLFL